MTKEESMKLKLFIADISQIYGQNLTRTAIDIIAESLEDLNVNDVVQSYKEAFKTKGFSRLPNPADIRAMIQPSVDPKSAAKELAHRIHQAVSKFGYTGQSQAKEFVGEAGWTIVERFGGWIYICENLGVTLDVGIFLAQARELAEAHKKFGKDALGEAARLESKGSEKVDNLLAIAMPNKSLI